MPWHVQALQRAVRSDVPSILLHGPAGIGERDFALALAAHWLCEADATADVRPCLDCASCKLVEAGNHPDLRMIEPASMAAESEDADGDDEGGEEKGKGKAASQAILIGQLRPLHDLARITSQGRGAHPLRHGSRAQGPGRQGEGTGGWAH